MASAQILAIAAAIVLLYVLIKGHLYALRKLWVPKFEEEIASESDEEGAGDEEVEGETGDQEGDDEDRPPRGWDVIR